MTTEYERIDNVLIPAAPPRVCRWFALCENPADGVVAHPILGDVPTCRRCAKKLDLKLEVTG